MAVQGRRLDGGADGVADASADAAALVVGLTAEQTSALFDILSHHETYSEIEAFKRPETVRRYGFPLSVPLSVTTQELRRQLQQQPPSPPQPPSSFAAFTGRFRSARTTPGSTAPGTPRPQTPVPPDGDACSVSSNRPARDDDEGPSSVPLLQLLLTRFILPLPAVRDLPSEFWNERVRGILLRLAEAELSESYDKGALGTRKTLATGSSAVLEMLGRGALGGVPRGTEVPGERRDYDTSKAEDLARAWDDVVVDLVYGDLIDGFFNHASRTDDLESHSPAVKAAADYSLIHLATLAHHVVIGSPEGQYLLKLLENAHSLVPYKLIKQTLRVGNAATMMSGMVRLLLAKISITSVTNWLGLTQSPDDGLNVLQRIVSLVLSWDSGEFRKGAERVAKDKGGPSEEVLRVLREHIDDDARDRHDLARAASLENGESIVASILNAADPALVAGLSEDQHTQCLAYVSALLSVRDRESITSVLCRQLPDLFTRIIKDAFAAYDPIIRSVHACVDLKEQLDAIQTFIDDFVKASKPKLADDGEERMAGVDEYVELLRRNKGLVYRWVNVLAAGCADVWEELRLWAKESAMTLRQGAGKNSGPANMAGRLNDLFCELDPAVRPRVLEAIDAHAVHLAALNDLSLTRLQSLLTPAASEERRQTAGPGVYLSRWQSLLNETPITPATLATPATVRRGKEVKHTTTVGKTGVGGEMLMQIVSGEDWGPEGPDVAVVFDALGDGFRDLVREMAKQAA
ncbi:hypothetical protein RJ55_04214 [Drechmeria coniospora]|nr:hypothetical protein RJ55_04214 [Drechmeria coniospora]